MKWSKSNAILETYLNELGIKFEKEYRFDKSRRWRGDYYLPELKTIVEIEGGVWVNGRHIRPQGYENDCEKYNKAQLLGYKVIRFTTTMINKKGDYVISVLKQIRDYKEI